MESATVNSSRAPGGGLAAELKAYAREVGFHLVGITTPEPFPEAELDITRWLREGHQAEMAWLNDARTRLATRPRELLPGARSLIVVGVSYRTDEPAAGAGGRVARYAWGSDYHDVLKMRLRLLVGFLSERVSRGIRARIFVDSGPLVERDAAVRAGLGFRGKNTNLLTSNGSYVFLGAVLTDVDLEPDRPLIKDCGTCRLCIDACPTEALDEAYHLAAERCIAYLTIEHRGPIDAGLRPKLGDWVFGCDVCQEVCPYNASSRRRPRGWAEFEPRELPVSEVGSHGTRLNLEQMLGLGDDGFRQAFRGSPIKRAKRRGMARNAALALGNQGEAAARPALARAADEHPEPVVREAAEWGLTRLPSSESGPADERAANVPQ